MVSVRCIWFWNNCHLTKSLTGDLEKHVDRSLAIIDDIIQTMNKVKVNPQTIYGVKERLISKSFIGFENNFSVNGEDFFILYFLALF